MSSVSDPLTTCSAAEKRHCPDGGRTMSAPLSVRSTSAANAECSAVEPVAAARVCMSGTPPKGAGMGKQLDPPPALALPAAAEPFAAGLRQRFGGIASLAQLADLLGLAGELSPALCVSAAITERFLTTTLPTIIDAACSLGGLSGASSICLQCAGCAGSLALPSSSVAALLASMLLGVAPPLTTPGNPELDGELLGVRDCSRLLASSEPRDVAVVAAIEQYFHAQSWKAPHREASVVCFRRCVLARDVDFAARSPNPMAPLHLDQCNGASDAGEMLARPRHGSAFACGACLEAPTADAVVCYPELLVGALLCPALRRDEALAVSGAEPMPCGACHQPAGTVLLFDPAAPHACGEAPPLSAEIWESSLRRDLEKAYCAFSVEGPELGPVSHALPRRVAVLCTAPPDADEAALALEAVIQWLAASEAGRPLRLLRW